MRRDPRATSSCHPQRDDQKLLRALKRQEPTACQRNNERECKLPRTTSQQELSTLDQLEDDDQWSDVCEKEYREVVQRGKALWREWATGSAETTNVSIASHQSARPEVADKSADIDNVKDTDVDGSGQVDQMFARQDHQPGRGSVESHDHQPGRSNVESSVVVAVGGSGQDRPGERRELIDQSHADSSGVVGFQQNAWTAGQLPASRQCDVSAPSASARYEGIEVCSRLHGRKKR